MYNNDNDNDKQKDIVKLWAYLMAANPHNNF